MKAAEVIGCLKARFEAPEWAVATELALAPGFAARRADAVALNCFSSGPWASAVLGFEVKVSRGDFLQELKQPAKRAETYRGVDALFLAVPEGLVRPEEVPADMGLVLCKAGEPAKIQAKPKGMKLPGASRGRPWGPSRTMNRDLAVCILRAFDPRRAAVNEQREVEQLKQKLESTKTKGRRLRGYLNFNLEQMRRLTQMP